LNEPKREYRESGAVAKKSRLTVSAVLEDWFTNVASKTSKASTQETNRGYIDKRIAPVLGSILVDRPRPGQSLRSLVKRSHTTAVPEHGAEASRDP